MGVERLMGDRWPWPKDDQTVRARKVAREYRKALERLSVTECQRVDRLMAEFGQTWMDEEDGTVVTTREAAELLGMSARGLRYAVKRGEIEWVRRDSEGWLFDRGVVAAYAVTRRSQAVASLPFPTYPRPNAGSLCPTVGRLHVRRPG